jgi:glycosyltransferase involved in cell wall biosynthesis
MMSDARIGVIVVAYNAESTLDALLDRIPPDFWRRVTGVWVSDDESSDGTHEVALAWQESNPHLPLTVVRQHLNQGYGGNQKAGYRWAIEQGLDMVVLLHGDAQYAPELLPEMVAPLARGDADAVLGSRMIVRGAARRGGMPLYKYIGNRVLTGVQNKLANADFSEWHSGYRAYSVAALREIDFEATSDGFDFDTEILLQLLAIGKRVVEVPIPTYYGGEICYVNGMRYALNVTVDMVEWRLAKLGFGTGRLASLGSNYRLHQAEGTAHQEIIKRLDSFATPRRVLDLGCSDGSLGGELQARGHHVVGIDQVLHLGVADRIDTFIVANLEHGLPELEGLFDVVVAADVLEHLTSPNTLLESVRDVMSIDGIVLVTVPNFAHWYPRARVALGAFDYDQRGILDRTHLRFFTRRSLRRLTRRAGYRVRAERPLGLPLDTFDAGDAGWRRAGWALFRRVEGFALRLRPTLFAYQYLLEIALPPGVVTSVPAPTALQRLADADENGEADGHSGDARAGHEAGGTVPEREARSSRS